MTSIIIMLEFYCNICNLEYKTQSGLWKHNNIHHTNLNDDIIEKKHLCKYCEKELCNRQSRWRHETQSCTKNPEINTTNNAQTINNVDAQNYTQNNIQTQNNTNIHNNNTINITFNKLGNEDISILTQDEIEEIINNGLNSIIKLIEFINFNNAHPQNHTFCTTSLNNKYTSVLNTETNTIEKHRKVDIYDKVLFYALNHIDMLKDKIIDKKKRKRFNKKILELEKNIYGDVKYKKIFIEQLNALSYNKRNIINNTWDNYFNKYISLII
jgi:hypothetical protein